MADHRSRRQKLEAMANQTASPHEAEVARRKLAQMGQQQRPEPQPDPYWTRWAAEDLNINFNFNDDMTFDAVWNSTTHRYEPRLRYRPYATYNSWDFSKAQTSNPAPDDAPPYRPSDEEPFWMGEWFRRKMKSLGMDDEEIDRLIREMK